MSWSAGQAVLLFDSFRSWPHAGGPRTSRALPIRSSAQRYRVLPFSSPVCSRPVIARFAPHQAVEPADSVSHGPQSPDATETVARPQCREAQRYRVLPFSSPSCERATTT
jgi:hypothetical protein